jgi:hypothetical protein
VIAGHRGLGGGLVRVCVRTGDVRDNSDLREFLFSGVDLRHRMSHAFAPHVPLGVVLRVDLEGIAAARVSTALTAPVPERPSAGNAAALPDRAAAPWIARPMINAPPTATAVTPRTAHLRIFNPLASQAESFPS